MASKGTVVLYFSRLGTPLRAHQKALLKADAKSIARLKQYDFEEQYDALKDYAGAIYFVPDDTLLLDEAQTLGIQNPEDLYGGVVPYLFVKTKSITHPLAGETADQPGGWSFQFADRVRNIVLPGYTAFGLNDARVAAGRVLPRGPIRIKRSSEAGGRGQTLIATVEELEAVLEEMPADEMATYGLVLEENLDQVTTLSIGHITFDNIRCTYHGRQTVTTGNDGHPAYGGSDLVWVRGSWDALDRVPMSDETRIAVNQARSYDHAMSDYRGFIASRRNYDVGQGLDHQGRQRSAVFEALIRPSVPDD